MENNVKTRAAWLALGTCSLRRQRNTWLALCLCLAVTGMAMPIAQGQMPSADELREMQKEMEEGMRLMQEEMGKLDPATRKQIDQLRKSVV